MTKRTTPLSSLNSETVEIFYEILGDGFRVKPENKIFENFRKWKIFQEYSIRIKEIETGTK